MFPGAVTSCARFNLPPTSASPVAFSVPSSPFLLPSLPPPVLVAGNHQPAIHHHRRHPPGVSPALTRVSFAARFVSSLPSFNGSRHSPPQIGKAGINDRRRGNGFSVGLCGVTRIQDFYGEVKNSSLFSHIPAARGIAPGLQRAWVEPPEDPLPHVTDPVALFARTRGISPRSGKMSLRAAIMFNGISTRWKLQFKTGERKRGGREIYFKLIKEFHRLKYIYISKKMYNHFIVCVSIYRIVNTHILEFFSFNLFCKLYDIQNFHILCS